MGKLKKLKNFVEKPLLSSSMLKYCLIEEVKGVRTRMICRLKNFSSLEPSDLCIAVCLDMNFLCVKYEDELFICFYHQNLNSTAGEIVLRKTNYERVMGVTDKTHIGYITMFPNEMILDPVNKLLHDDTLTIECICSTRPLENNIVLMPSSRETTNECMQNSDVDMLLNDLKHLYLSSDLYDFVIKFQNVYFKAHKLILRSSSDYFKDFFYTNPDCESTEVHIKRECRPLAMHEVLLYAYSGEFRNNDSIAFTIEILCIADKLKFGKLTQLCMQTLKSTFSHWTVKAYLMQAEDYGLECVIKAVKEFFEELPEVVRQNNQWKSSYEMAVRLYGIHY